MFTKSNNGIITVNRGDTFTTTLYINEGDAITPSQYVLQGDDKVYFAVCEPNQEFEDALVRKVYTKDDLDEDNNVVVSFASTDTEYLLPGTYYYTAKLNKVFTDTSKNEINTFIQRTKFIII